MSHGVQLVELHGTRRGDKTLQGCHDPSCGQLCNMFLQQNSYLSQSETTTKILCARAQEKKRWLPSVAELVLLLLTGINGIERKKTACYFDDDY